MPIPRAVVDADTLYRRHARNVLVWHALTGLFELHWSARILAETRDHLMVRNRAAFGESRVAAVDRTLQRVTDALRLGEAGGLVPERMIRALEPTMTNDRKDRHVLAAAVAAGAHTVVTTNVRDFPSRATEPHGIAARTPDAFLTSLLAPSTVDAAMDALARQADFHGWSIAELLALLTSATTRRPALLPCYVRRIAKLSGVGPAANAP